jgi:tRNA (cytidine/uridine-2'-O-)-methyltransferase
MSKKAETKYTDIRFAPDDVFVFGCETKGLPTQIMQQNPANLLKIPISPEARCLNLSVSVGITLFEAKRQVENNAEL